MVRHTPTRWPMRLSLLLGAISGGVLAAWIVRESTGPGESALGSAYLAYILGYPTSLLAIAIVPSFGNITNLPAYAFVVLPIHYAAIGVLIVRGWKWRASRHESTG